MYRNVLEWGGVKIGKKPPPKNKKNTHPRSSPHDPCLPPLPPARRQEVPLPYRPLPPHSPTQTHPRTPYFSAEAGHHHMHLRPPGCPCCFCTANLFSYAIILKHPRYSVPATLLLHQPTHHWGTSDIHICRGRPTQLLSS